MIIDGNRIAADILDTLKQTITASGAKVSLEVFVVGSDYATEKFISFKRKKAEGVGIDVSVTNFPPTIATENLIKEIQQYSKQHTVNDGVVIQLPLPKHIDTKAVLEYIPIEKDIDVLSSRSRTAFEKSELDILPPVVGSIKEIIDRSNISLRGMRAVVIGKGALVGRPSAVWLEQQGAIVTSLDASDNIRSYVKDADVIVSGAGVPGLITPDMIKEGVILFDAGTSESGGKLVGDATEDCALKCQIFTPTPGGIGPITVALLLQNLVSRTLD